MGNCEWIAIFQLFERRRRGRQERAFLEQLVRHAASRELQLEAVTEGLGKRKRKGSIPSNF